jgi:hypothetical protein
MHRKPWAFGLAYALAFLTLVTATACGRQRYSAARSESLPAAQALAKIQAEDSKQDAAPVKADFPVVQAPLKLIRTSSVQIEVKDFDAAASTLGGMAKSMGGYVADTQVTRHEGGDRSGQIVLRIPAERFDAAGGSIRALGKVLSEQSSVQDVTKAYADLETRLKVKREELSRIREIMKSRAGTLKDILEAENEISRITEEIEVAEGERQYYDHQIRLSTITVELREPTPVNLASSWSAVGNVFRNASTMIAESLAALLSILLVLVPWLLAAYGIYRWIRWILRRRKARLQPKPSEPSNS